MICLVLVNIVAEVNVEQPLLYQTFVLQPWCLSLKRFTE